jgi:hypothetical protein
MFEQSEREGKNLSVEEVGTIQKLIVKIREFIEWDLGASAATSEELDLVNAAKNAVKEFEVIFDMPPTRFWAEPEREEHRPRPVAPKTVLPEDMEKLRSDLAAIQEVVDWDIDGGDDEGRIIIKETKEALIELKNLL